MSMRPLAAAAAVAAILLTTSLASQTPGNRHATGSGVAAELLPPLGEKVSEQLRADALIRMTDYDENAPSMVRTSRDTTEDHNVGAPHISLGEAIKSAAEGSGLSPETAVAASLVMVTPSAYGYPVTEDGAKEPSSVLPIYDNTASWAVEFDGVSIPHGSFRGGLGSKPEQESPTPPYETNMIVFVDAYTGDFMLGAQYDSN